MTYEEPTDLTARPRPNYNVYNNTENNVVIEDEAVPQEELPVVEEPEVTEEIKEIEEMAEIFDEEVPLAAVPKTSDNVMFWAAMMLLSGTAAAGMTVVNSKRKVNG